MNRTLAAVPLRVREAVAQPVVVVGLLLVVLQTALRSPVLLANWFYTDDYALLRRAQQEAHLTVSYLLEPSNSHLTPGSRLLYWWVAEMGPLNWTLAAAISLTVQLLTSLAALWMLTSVFGARWGILAPLAIYLSTAITAQASLWWVSSVNQTPVQLAFFVAVGGGVRYLRSRRWRWLFVSMAGVILGLLFFQKILLVAPVLAFLALAYFARGGLLERLLTTARAYWPAVVALAVVSGGYLVYNLVFVEQPFSERGDSPLELADNMIRTAFLTGAFGGPWGWAPHDGGAWADPPEWAEALSPVLATLVILYGALTRKASLRAWVLLAGYLVMSVALIALTRTGVFGNDIGLAYRLQTDVVCVLALSVGLAFMEVPGARESSTSRERPLLTVALPPVAVVLAVAAVTVSGAINWATYARDWLASNRSEPYLAALGRELDRLEPVDLVDGILPPRVMPRIFAPDNRVSSLAPLLSDSVDFPRSSDRLGIVSYDGTVHQVLIKAGQSSRPGPLDGCGWLVKGEGRSIPLRGRAMELDWWMRIGYLADRAFPVTVSAGGRDVSGQIRPGLNNLYVRIEGTFDEVTLHGLPEGDSVCVDTIELGLPMAGPRL